MNDLLSLIKLNEWQNLSGLNICFITHSPFILSDIPSDRIMFLTENGEQDKEILTKTFGANIHELLTDGFFLSNTIGEYALNQIRDIIDFHTSVMNADKVSKINLLKVYNDNKKRYNYLVDNIGEDYISGILKNHINDIETSLYGDQYKEVKIKELELEIERIKEMK
ncbi:MAG: hypothetical protein IPO21_19250 [Bacteroidales bacterium]|nr:hypothetical protein [Bacteroidales bacterium]